MPNSKQKSGNGVKGKTKGRRRRTMSDADDVSDVEMVNNDNVAGNEPESEEQLGSRRRKQDEVIKSLIEGQNEIRRLPTYSFHLTAAGTPVMTMELRIVEF